MNGDPEPLGSQRAHRAFGAAGLLAGADPQGPACTGLCGVRAHPGQLAGGGRGGPVAPASRRDPGVIRCNVPKYK